MKERHNTIVNALELRLSCTNPSIWSCQDQNGLPRIASLSRTLLSVLWWSEFIHARWMTGWCMEHIDQGNTNSSVGQGTDMGIIEFSGLILGLRPPNERRCYKVTPSLIGWAQTWNLACSSVRELLILSTVIMESACMTFVFHVW